MCNRTSTSKNTSTCVFSFVVEPGVAHVAGPDVESAGAEGNVDDIDQIEARHQFASALRLGLGHFVRIQLLDFPLDALRGGDIIYYWET